MSIYFLNETSACVVDRGFESRSGQHKDYKIGMCCFSVKHAALRRKSKDRLARNRYGKITDFQRTLKGDNILNNTINV
jgi:hypothetical protein